MGLLSIFSNSAYFHQTSSIPIPLVGRLALLVTVSGSGLMRTHTPRSELLPKLLPLNISQALEMALEQKELDQEPGAGKWVLSRRQVSQAGTFSESGSWVEEMNSVPDSCFLCPGVDS